MFLFPSKPTLIYNANTFVQTLKSIGDIDNWVAQIKKNGSRCIPSIDGKVKLQDRAGKTLTVGLEEDWSILKEIFGDKTLLDGELIGRKQGEVSNRLYLWDLPIYKGENLTNLSYIERYQILIDIVNSLPLSFIKKFASQEVVEKDEITVGNKPEAVINKYLDPDSKDFYAFNPIEGAEIQLDLNKIKIAVAKCFKPTEINVLMTYLAKGSTEENEGIVFKKFTHNLSWSYLKTRDITEQVKFLRKFL